MITKELYEKFHELLKYDSLTGDLYWKVDRCALTVANTKAGSKDKYVLLKILGKTYKAHRVIWFMTYGKWPIGDIDHIDGCPYNNRLQNLRDVSTSGNMQNQTKAHKCNKSGFLGVTKMKDSEKWRARITLNKKQIYLGTFENAEEAHKVYLDAKRELHECSTL